MQIINSKIPVMLPPALLTVQQLHTTQT